MVIFPYDNKGKDLKLFKNIVVLLMGTSLLISNVCADSYGDLLARIDDLEKRLNGQAPSGNDLASKEDLDQLKNSIRELRGDIEEIKHSLKANSFAVVSQSQSSLSDSSKNQDHVDESDIDDLLKNLSAQEDIEDSLSVKREKATQQAEQKAPTGKIESDDPSAQYNQALALYKTKEYAQAEESFQYYVTTYKNGKQVSQAKLKIAQCQLALAKQNKDKSRAKEAAKNFAGLYKANMKSSALGGEALLGMGESMIVQGDSQKACVVFRKLKTDFPNDKDLVKRATEFLKKHEKSA